MIKGKTKSGIKYSIQNGLTDDVRILTCLVKLEAEQNASTQLLIINNLLELIFGGEEGAQIFMNAVASVHEGVCKAEYLVAELKEILEASNLKN